MEQNCIENALNQFTPVNSSGNGNQPPKPQHVTEEEKAKAAKYLEENGYYRNIQPEMFDTVANIIAMINGFVNRPKGVMLRGDFGIGKSTGLKLVARRFPRTIVYRTAAEIVEAYENHPTSENLRRLFDGGDYDYGKDIKGVEIGFRRTLIIDDLGAERTYCNYGKTRELLAELIDYRYEKIYPQGFFRTFFTTNLTDNELTNRYGSRNFDRLKEFAPLLTVHGGSLRGRILPPAANQSAAPPVNSGADNHLLTPEEIMRNYEIWKKTGKLPTE